MPKTMTLRDIHKVTQGFEGWVSCPEGILLWYFARSGSGEGDIVEIGSWKGKSTIWLACGSKSVRRERIVSVDPHTAGTYGEFLRNLKEVGINDWVIPVIGISQELAQRWARDVRLVYVDGSHEYEDVKEDFRLCFELLGDDGIIALHDSLFEHEGPTKVVELLLRNAFAIHVGFVGSITFCQKGKQSTFQQVRNTLLLLAFRLLRRSGIADLGRPRFSFWLSFLLNATDTKSIRTAFWTYWQAIKLGARFNRPDL
jgi:predicted O-methyltransferase YrrM